MDAVLRADDGCLEFGATRQLFEGGHRVLTLDCEEHDVVTPATQSARLLDDIDIEMGSTRRRCKTETRLGDRPSMRTPRDEYDIMTVLHQSSPDDATVAPVRPL